jgi:hypothetical protein
MGAFTHGSFREPYENGLGHSHGRDIDFYFDRFCLDSNE